MNARRCSRRCLRRSTLRRCVFDLDLQILVSLVVLSRILDLDFGRWSCVVEVVLASLFFLAYSICELVGQCLCKRFLITVTRAFFIQRSIRFRIQTVFFLFQVALRTANVEKARLTGELAACQKNIQETASRYPSCILVFSCEDSSLRLWSFSLAKICCRL